MVFGYCNQERNSGFLHCYGCKKRICHHILQCVVDPDEYTTIVEKYFESKSENYNMTDDQDCLGNMINLDFQIPPTDNTLAGIIKQLEKPPDRLYFTYAFPACPNCGDKIDDPKSFLESCNIRRMVYVMRYRITETWYQYYTCKNCCKSMAAESDNHFMMVNFYEVSQKLDVAVSDQLLYKYFLAFCNSGTPQYTWYDTYLAELPTPTRKKMPPLRSFNQYYYQFLSRLTFKNAQPFVCPHCGDSPEIVICDGNMTTMYARWYNENPITVSTASEDHLARERAVGNTKANLRLAIYIKVV